MCKLCKERGKIWQGSDPVCAFDELGNLKDKDFRDNWNCAILNKLRHICYNDNQFYTSSIAIFSEDEWGGVIAYDGNFIFLNWYKNRGGTQYIKIINNNCYGDDAMTDEEICLDFINHFNKIEQGINKGL